MEKPEDTVPFCNVVLQKKGNKLSALCLNCIRILLLERDFKNKFIWNVLGI